MASLKDIKKRIGTVKNTRQITKAMKIVITSYSIHYTKLYEH